MAVPLHAFFSYCLILLLLVCLPISSSAQNNGNISIGASLTALQNSDSWRSPSGHFAFGFRQLPDNKDLFLLSIWFDKIRDKTIVWYERTSYPVPRGSIVRLDAQLGLVLRDPQNTLLYSSNSFSTRVGNAFLSDTGNLVLRSSDSTWLWESFKNPTDTILPTQTIDINGELNSRLTPTNFSRGRFFAQMRVDGDFVMTAKAFPGNTGSNIDYFQTQTNDANDSNSGYQLVFDERSLLAIVRRSGERSALTTPGTIPSYSDNYYRATLDFDGIFVQYYHPKNLSGDQKWEMATLWPYDICQSLTGRTGSGACGFNSICRMQNSRPVCECPQSFSLVDPNNTYGDCKANYEQNCIQRGRPGLPIDEYDVVEIPEVDWPDNDYIPLEPSTEEQCRNLCLTDCFCGAAIFVRPGRCYTKRLPLSNGRRVDASRGIKAFVKYGKGENDTSSPNPNRPSIGEPDQKDQRTLILVLSVLLGASFLLICLIIGIGCLGFNCIYNKIASSSGPADQDTCGSNLLCFTYKELVRATDEFNEELGRGSFGIVYKGVIPNSSNMVVAVKKLDRVARDSEKEFRAEVSVIGKTHHKNLVRLIGFCNEGPHRLLVYEYMSNGTLADYLFRDDVRPSWSQRMQIALGVARGLTYLHDECSTQIIHCDIKPQNILLDEFYNSRISDFGLAKTLVMNQSRTHTNIRGTKGYICCA